MRNLLFSSLTLVIFFLVPTFLTFAHKVTDEIKIQKVNNYGSECVILLRKSSFGYGLKISESDYESTEILINKLIKNDSESIQIISKQKLDKNLIDMLLCYSIYTNNFLKVRLLVEKGADLSKVWPFYIRKITDPEIIKILINNKLDLSEIFISNAAYKDYQIAKLILESGLINVNFKCKYGMTPLMAATIGRFSDMVKILIARGARVNEKYSDGDTPLMMAAVNNPNSELIKILVENSAEINIKNNFGEYPLEMLMQRGGNEISVEYLLKKGANSESQAAALLRAITNKQFNYVKILLENSSGIDPLILKQLTGYYSFALKNNDLEFIKTLVAKGLKVKIDELLYAIDNNQIDMLRYLIHNFDDLKDNIIELNSQASGRPIRSSRDYRKPDNILMKIIKSGQLEMAKIIIEELNKRDICYYENYILDAIESDNPEMVKMIIETAKYPRLVTSSNFVDPQHGWPLLITTIINGQDRISEILIEKGTDINQKMLYGLTPIIYAVWYGRTKIAKLLLDKGADANSKSKDGTSALMFASMAGHTEAIKLLLDHGANIESKNDNGINALVEAITSNRTAAVKLLKARGADLTESKKIMGRIKNIGTNVNTKDIYGVSFLMRAAYEGNLIKLKYLIDHGARVNDLSVKRGTPLSNAFICGMHVDVLKMLLDKGADPYLKNDNKTFSSLLANTMNSCPHFFYELLNNKPPSIKVDISIVSETIISSFKTTEIDLLLNNCEDINSKIQTSCIPKEIPFLFYAIVEERFDIVKLLLKNGANINVMCETPVDKYISMNNSMDEFEMHKYYGGNALFFANNNLNTIKFLCDNGCDINHKNYFGYTPLMFMVSNGTTELIKFLLDKGAYLNISSTDKKKITPLIISMTNTDNPKVMNLLIDKGANVNQKIHHGWTPLMMAVKYKNAKAVEILINSGAEINTVNDDGAGALDIAYDNYEKIDENILSIIKTLKNSGAINFKKTYNDWN